MPRRPVHRRPVLSCLCACAAALLGAAPASAGGPVTLGNWNGGEQRQVIHSGVMSNLGAGFGGARPLSTGEMRDALAVLAPRLAPPAPPAPPAAPSGPTGTSGPAGVGGVTGPIGVTGPAGVSGGGGPTGVTGVTGIVPSPARATVQARTPAATPVAVPASTRLTVVNFDALVVDQLGLRDVAEHVQSVARGAGLRPPYYFGSEVVARFLSLRYMQPTVDEALEPYPTDLITRAEAAHSFSVVLGFSGWQVQQARAALSAFALPHYTAAQRRVLSLAVSKIGMPYVWGGTTDNTADGLPHGGYDCSGFAWRVYKLSGFSWGAKILGRTAAQQAGEIPRSQRVRMSRVQPADLLFFGNAHFDSTATEANVIHEGIALGDNWVIHSSGQGVYVLPLQGSWLGSSFTWARRVI